MKTNIILSGVGGQGILSIATVLGEAALQNNLYLKQAEIHGMSQRGGDVQSHLRLSDQPIASDLIPTGCVDLILSLEPMEALRYKPYLSEDGWIVSSNQPFCNIPDYPNPSAVLHEIEQCTHFHLLDVENLAKEAGSPRCANMVLLGAALPYLHLPAQYVEKAIETIFFRKGEAVVAMNLKALHIGFEVSQ